jgi:ABC-type nitrate/sulfonate/bicarbonate transport system substrate-binding protein
MAVAALLAGLAWAVAANAADKLVLQLHGPAQFQFAGYYAALWQGYYRDAGLEVEIKPGAGIGEAAIDPVREVTEGKAQFGTGTADLVVRAAQGLPLLLLAPVFQQSGAAIYYRADGDFGSPAALAKGKLGRLPASNILDIELVTALKSEGIDPDKLKPVPLEPGKALAALADRSVDAVPGSAWELPWLAREKGLAVKSFDPADYRVAFYGDTLFTLRRLAAADPTTARQFRAASLKGWDYALQHPDEIAQRLVAELPHPPGIADPAAFDRYQAGVASQLSGVPAVALGHSNPDRWNRIEASMVGAGALLRTADADEFVYDPDAAARNRTDLRALAIVAATLLGGLAVIAWLWLRRRRRPVAGIAATATPAPASSAAPTAPAAPMPATTTPATTMPATAAPVVPATATATPAAPAPKEPAPADLNAVLSALEQTLRQRTPRRVAFRLSLLGELWRCHAEPQIVRGLVLDLAAAAMADLKGKGELVVGTRNFAFDATSLATTPGAQLGEYARITVRDNGSGLSEEALDRVFDRTVTARPSAAAAAEAMRAIGGFARVESAEGVGTAVHLYFPRVAAAAGEPPAKSAAAAE